MTTVTDTPDVADEHPAPRPSIGTLPGLTGLRGIAVVAVVAYHLGYLPGGFVGVDLFFVLSGFLITSLLMSRPPVGAAGLRRWWARRVRRLTPAVAVVVLAVLALFLTRSGIALDAVATMTWWQNWHLIAEGTSYWASSPSPLRHAWSLSIEEQFYLLWPVTLLGLLALGRRWRRPAAVVAGAAALGAAASFLWASWLSGADGADLSRIYFGTDTRIGALLVGCAAAAWMQREPERWRRPPRVRPAVSVTAVGAGILLAVLSVSLAPDSLWSYRGGLALVALSALVLVVACSGPGPVSSALSGRVLQWLGTRSYAIYLWSWPIQLTVQERWPDLELRWVAATTALTSLLLADVSMRVVENPLRFGTGWAQGIRPRQAAWGLGLVALVVGSAVAARSTVPTTAERLAQEFEQVPDPTTTVTAPGDGTGPTDGVAPTAPPTTVCVPTTDVATQFSGGDRKFDPSTVEGIGDPVGDKCGATRVLVVGDSTGRGAANGLRRAPASGLEVWDRTVLGCGIEVNPAKCPSWRTIWPAAVQEVRPQVVLVHLGVSVDVVDGPEPRFTAPEAAGVRQQVIGEAMDALAATGARVVWTLPAVPLDNGTFYCGGSRKGTGCDPDWIARWNADVVAAATPRGVAVVNLEDWVASRGRTKADRPDGLHFSGAGLDAEAALLAPQLR